MKIDKLQSTFHQWESTSNAAEQGRLTKEVRAGCESIEWQVDLLHASAEPMTYRLVTDELFHSFNMFLS